MKNLHSQHRLQLRFKNTRRQHVASMDVKNKLDKTLDKNILVLYVLVHVREMLCKKDIENDHKCECFY